MADVVETQTTPIFNNDISMRDVINGGVYMNEMVIGKRTLQQSFNHGRVLIADSNLRDILFEGIRVIIDEYN